MLRKVTLEAPAGNVVTLHDVTTGDTNAVGAAVKSAAGLIGLPTPKEAQRERYGAHGGYDRARYVDRRGPTFEGELWGLTHAEALARHDDLTHALWSMLETPGILRYERLDGLELRAEVKPGSYDPLLENASRLLPYSLQLSQPEPRAFGAPVTTVGEGLNFGGGGLMFPFTFPLQFLGSSGGRVELENAGTADAPLVIRVYGRVVAPRIRVTEVNGVAVANGAEIVLAGEIAEGVYYEIDTDAGTVKLNGSVGRMEQLDASSSTFMVAPARSTVALQLIASDFDVAARLEVDVSSAYGG